MFPIVNRQLSFVILFDTGPQPSYLFRFAAIRKGSMKYIKGPIRRGYANKILYIDLAGGSIKTPDIDLKVRDYFLGGRSPMAFV